MENGMLARRGLPATILKRPHIAPARNIEARRSLSLGAILDAARAEAGLRDFGNEDFLVPLHRLIGDMLTDTEFTPIGLDICKGNFQRILVNRLRLEQDLKDHPEILDEDVADPIIVTGMPRTGTTKLQRVFSADPDVQALWIWRVLNPAPFPNAPTGQPDPRIAAARSYESANESYNNSHEIRAEFADEDLYLLATSLDYFGQVVWSPTNSYLDWSRKRPRITAYIHEKKMLQYLQWQDGGKRGRRWILKTPLHIGCLDVIAEVFPHAFVINSRRKMEELIASYCKSCEAIWATAFSNITAEWIGSHALELWAPEFAHAETVKARLGNRLQITDAPYARVVSDPVEIVKEVYDRLGVKLADYRLAAMAEWEATHEQHKHGKFEYALEEFGLTSDLVRQAFPTE